MNRPLAQAIVLLVLLVSWLDDGPGPIKNDLEVIEFFSGAARVSKLSHRMGMRVVAYDMDYASAKPGRRGSMDLNSNAGFALAIKLILRSKFNAVIGIFAVCCSSFVPVNRGTGGRDILVPGGDERVVHVRKSNKLLGRNLGDFSSALRSTSVFNLLIAKECNTDGSDGGSWRNLGFGKPSELPDCLAGSLCVACQAPSIFSNPSALPAFINERFLGSGLQSIVLDEETHGYDLEKNMVLVTFIAN